MKDSVEFMRGWLQAIYDGEGCISVRLHPSGKNCLMMQLKLNNTDPDIIKTTSKFLRHFGIKYSVYSVKVKDGYLAMSAVVTTDQSSLLKFHREIGFRSKPKIEKLRICVQYIQKRKRLKTSIERGRKAAHGSSHFAKL